MEVHWRTQALTANVYTEIHEQDGKTFLYVFSPAGDLLEVMESMTSGGASNPPAESEKDA